MSIGKQIQIGNLGFDDIRNSIIKFLKTEKTGAASNLNDYDYDGSALSTLIDLLAYNTLYYGYYTNMIANEMFLDSAQRQESLISLTKPLGYAIPGYNSAVATVSITEGGSWSTIKRLETVFQGKNSEGVLYNFRTIKEYTLTDQGKWPDVKLYEAKSLVDKKTFEVDIDSQSIVLRDYPDIEISSLLVEVNSGTYWDEYFLSSNITTDVDEDQKLYWLERDINGFRIIFGGLEEEVTNRNVGRPIGAGDSVRLSFIRSSGKAGDGVFGFSETTDDLYEGNEITLLEASSGGSDGPNLDSVRFYAPRWFAAQDRAVTKNDCIATLNQSGYGEDYDTPFSLWGGDEMDPPKYGKVFMSFDADSTCTAAKDILDEKLVVTIVSKCIPSEDFVLLCTIDGVYLVNSTTRNEEQLEVLIGSTINKNYGEKRFGTIFRKDDLVDELKKKEDALTITSLILNLRSDQLESTEKRTIRFLNNIKKGETKGDGIFSTEVTDSMATTYDFFFEDNPDTEKIEAFRYVNGVKEIILDEAGTIDYETGTVIINAGVATSSFNMIAFLPEDQTDFIAKENMFLEVASHIRLSPQG
jgi:hypothetical protein